jgi:hypothetical protein
MQGMPTLGEKLKAGRERRGATTSQAAAATRIMVQHIEAMESNQFQRIPAPTYAKGFIRMYATYVGLDPAPLVREYTEVYMPKKRSALTPPDEAARPARIIEAAPAPVPPAGEAAAARPSPVAFGKAWQAFSSALGQAWSGFRPALQRVPWKRALVAVLLIAAAALIGRAVIQARGRPSGPVVVDAADAVRIPAGVPSVIREPPEPYLDNRPAGRRAP